jgi:hypothetical protein
VLDVVGIFRLWLRRHIWVGCSENSFEVVQGVRAGLGRYEC